MGHELVCGGKFGVGRLDMTLRRWTSVLGQLVFPFVSAPLPHFGPLVEGRLRVREAYKGCLPETYTTPVVAWLVCSSPLFNEPLYCWDEIVNANLPEVSSECGLPLLVVIELLD